MLESETADGGGKEINNGSVSTIKNHMLTVWFLFLLATFRLTSASPAPVAKDNDALMRCGSMDIQDTEELQDYQKKCQVIEGHLRFLLVEKLKEEDVVSSLSLPHLIQVTDYVLIYRVNPLQTLGDLLPNLSVIGGQKLFHGYSLVVFGNAYLTKIGLNNLTDILNGSVRVENNWSLCPGPDIRWDKIIRSSERDDAIRVIENNYPYCFYHPCEEDGTCSTRLVPHRHKICSTTGEGYCYQDPKCHPECAGGCLRTGDPSACVACRHFLVNGTCVASCSDYAPHLVSDGKYKCIEKANCGGITEIRVGENGEKEQVCNLCTEDSCMIGDCRSTTITSTNLGDSLKKCTRIDGNLIIEVAAGKGVMRQLEENLKNIRVITGYLRVFRSNVLYSLSFLNNLEAIEGNFKDKDKNKGDQWYALYVMENDNLQELWNFSQRANKKLTIGNNGEFYFYLNRKLCPKIINELAGLTGVTNVYSVDNGKALPCYDSEMEMSVVPGRKSGTIQVTWKHIYKGIDSRFLPGYFVYYREAPGRNVTLFGGRDACNDKRLWGQSFYEYTKDYERTETISGLKPFTDYAVYVMAFYAGEVRSGARSRIHYVQTLQSEPSAVTGIRLRERNANSLTLEWKKPSVANGVLCFYEVTYRRARIQSLVSGEHVTVCQSQRIYWDSNSEGSEAPRDSSDSSSKNRISKKKKEDPDNAVTGSSAKDKSSEEATKTCCPCSEPEEYNYWTKMKNDQQAENDFENALAAMIYIKSGNSSKKDATNNSKQESKANGSHPSKTTTSTTTISISSTTPTAASPDAGGGVTDEGITPLLQRKTTTPTTETMTTTKLSSTAAGSLNFSCADQRHSDPVLGYRRSDDSQVMIIRTENTTVTLLNLTHYTFYEVSIKACNDGTDEGPLCNKPESELIYNTAPDIRMNAITDFNLTLEGDKGEEYDSGTERNNSEIVHQETTEGDKEEENDSGTETNNSEIVQQDTTEGDKEEEYDSRTERNNSEIVHQDTTPQDTTHQDMTLQNTTSQNATLQNTTIHNTTFQNTTLQNTTLQVSTLHKINGNLPSRRSKGTAEDEVRSCQRRSSSEKNIVVKWSPPLKSNGPRWSYFISVVNLDTSQESNLWEPTCLTEDEADRTGYTCNLGEYDPGTYKVSIKLRSEGAEGEFSAKEIYISGSGASWEIAVFVIIGILIVIVCVTGLYVYSNKNKQGVASDQQCIVTTNMNYGELLDRELRQIKQKYIISPEDLEIDFSKILGRGGFGVVYEGALREASGNIVKVAVKDITQSDTVKVAKGTLQEVKHMQDINSNFIVPLVGVLKGRCVYVVLELMENGDLKTFLTSEHGSLITDEKMIELAVDAADGMAYLAARKLVHRDLAARNCMLDARLTLKIGDFGLTRYIAQDYYKKQQEGRLPVRWLAPEALEYGRFTSRSDVWSYGVLLWEIYTRGGQPYEGQSNDTVYKRVLEGLRLKQPPNCPDYIHNIMRRCWKTNPKERETFIELITRLLPKTPKEYLANFEKVSFFYKSGRFDSESTEGKDEGFNASGSLDASLDEDDDDDREDEQSFSSLQNDSLHHTDDDQVCLTHYDEDKQSSCASMSCISGSFASQGIRMTPTRDTMYKFPHYRSYCSEAEIYSENR